jgi:hypothetical protein
MRTIVWGALALSVVGALTGARSAQAQAACVAWVAGGTYSQGEVVTYNGATYTSLIQQTDVAGTGWIPTIPGLFVLGGSCSGSTTPPPPPPPPPPAAGITSGASYNIVNPLSSLVLDVAGCGNANGTPLDLWAKGVNVCNNGSGQVWSPTLNSDGTYTLTNPASGLVLDVSGCGAASGTAVDLWANGVAVCDSGAGQKWTINTNSDGTYTLVNPLTSNALDVSGCGTANGTRVQTWANGVGVCDGGAGQKWQFVTPAATSTPPPAGTGKIVGGYYPWWVGSPVRLINVPSVYNLIYLFAATPTGGSAQTGAVTFTLPADTNGAATNWAADIQTVRNVQHRKVMLSVGGSGFAMSFPNRAFSQAFLSSVEALYSQWGGFDGLDWDTFEGIGPNVSEMIWVSQQLKAAYPGFIISAPPAPWNTSDQQLCVTMLQAGALDYCAPQYYDGPNLADPSWILPNVDVWMGLIPPQNFVFGFGIDPNLSNYETIAVGISVWQSISAKYPSIGGAFDWQINEDLLNGSPFAEQLGPVVNPGGAAANVP